MRHESTATDFLVRTAEAHLGRGCCATEPKGGTQARPVSVLRQAARIQCVRFHIILTNVLNQDRENLTTPTLSRYYMCVPACWLFGFCNYFIGLPGLFIGPTAYG
jgi:hypothetical protein